MESLHPHLIVGLGNPGTTYARTRHNAGFMLVELLGRRWQLSWSNSSKCSARMARGNFSGRPVVLGQPLTFMNLSGEAVRKLVDYFHVPLERMMIVADDADLPLGTLRLRAQGGSGGHHGLESVEQHLSTRAYARLRLGVGRTIDGRREITDHVLGRFSEEETKVWNQVLERAAGQMECWLAAGTQIAMNRFNGVVTDSDNQSVE